MTLRLPDPCLVVLIGASGSGKSHWAANWFRSEQIVSSDALRGIVGHGEHDQRATKDAFEVLELIVSKRLKRRLTTVIDSTALEAKLRHKYVALAARHGVPAVAVVFETSAAICRERNRSRARPVPAKILTGQIDAAALAAALVPTEGFAAVDGPAPVELVPPSFLTAPASAARQQEEPMALEFGLQVSRFPWKDDTAAGLATIARAAEDAGFSSLWLMDHFVQIPAVGREWEDMLDSYTTLGYLAAVTDRITLGTLVTGITYRNIAHVGKLVATLDVLSGGRAWCGLGAAWFEHEHRLYGWRFPPLAERYAALEDALQLLPLLWGPGSPSFEGRTISVPAATCYPRPLQERVPLLVGGSGERTTLRLVAQYADACNLFGDAETVRHKVEVLRQHCAACERDPAEVRVTQLSTARVIGAGAERTGPEAGTVEEQIGRYRELADAGVQTPIVSLSDLDGPESVERFAPVIAAFGR